MCARTFGGADDGAEVMRVGQLVAEDDERRLPFFRGAGEDVVDGGIVVRGDDGDDALVRAGGGELVELAPVGLDDDGPGLLRHGGEARERAVGIALGEIDLVDGAAGRERLGHGVAPFEQVFRRLGVGASIAPRLARAAVIVSVFPFFHKWCLRNL